MTERQYLIVIEGNDDAGFSAYAPDLPGCVATGATIEEVMEVLKLCVVQGIEACNLGVPILAEELKRFQEER